jgi:hypothetical protein
MEVALLADIPAETPKNIESVVAVVLKIPEFCPIAIVPDASAVLLAPMAMV